MGDGEIAVETLEELFQLLLMYDHKRRVLAEYFTKTVQKCAELHQKIGALGVLYNVKTMLKDTLSEQQLADVETSIKTACKDIMSLRNWAVAHVDEVKECPLPGTPLN